MVTETENETNCDYNVESKVNSETDTNSQEFKYDNDEDQPRKISTGLIIFIILVVSTLITSAIKNPPESESREMVKSYIVDKVNNKLRSEMTKDDNDGITQFGAFLGMAFASKIIDYACEINTNNYIIFTTFDCTAEIDNTRKTIVSGIILWGKIIPLKTDLKRELVEQ